MAVNIGLGERTYQKTEVFDTPGNHTWTHPLPGQSIEVFVEAFGGGGGGSDQVGVGGTGGDTIWDTSGASIIAVGGAGVGTVAERNSTGIAGQGLYGSGNAYDASGPLGGIITNGSNHYGAGVGMDCAPNCGDVKRFNVIVNGDVNLTVGAGGIGVTNGADNYGNGKPGAIIISYNITTTQTPVVVNMQRRDWEHFGEVSWRTAGTTTSQLLAAQVWSTLNIDTETLDTGNKVTVDGGNLFTLQAGTYSFKNIIPRFGGDSATGAWRLYNVTDSATEVSETFASDYHNYGSNHYNPEGIISIPSAKQFRLEYFNGNATTNIQVGVLATQNNLDSELTDRVKFQFKWRP
jgi:hypothetical protein